jgi:hypothetical protein
MPCRCHTQRTPARGDQHSALGELRGHPDLTKGRKLRSPGQDRRLYLLGHPVLAIRSAPAELLEAFQAILLELLLETLEGIPGVAHRPAGLAHIAEGDAQL